MADPKNPTIQVTHEQMLQLVIIETEIEGLQASANRLGGMLKLTDSADVLVEAIGVLARGREALLNKWRTGLVIAQPGQAIINGAPLK